VSGGVAAGRLVRRRRRRHGRRGSGEYAQGAFTVRGEGNDFGGTTESFTTVYQRLPTNGQIVARIEAFPARPGESAAATPQAMAGLMIRQNLGCERSLRGDCTVGSGGATFLRAPKSGNEHHRHAGRDQAQGAPAGSSSSASMAK